MTATLYRFPVTPGGRQALRDHLHYLQRFGRPEHEDYVEAHEIDWDQLDRDVDEALAEIDRIASSAP